MSLIQALTALDVNARGVSADSRTLRPDDLFLAYPGQRGDGRWHISAAIKRGAAAVVWESEGYAWQAEHVAPNLACENLQTLAGDIAAQILGEPSRQLRLIGVTGTNGKTSTTQWIARAYAALRQPCGVIGTLGAGFPDALVETANTTPDAVSLQTTLAEFVAAGAQAAALEVSSIGLEQGRLNGASFDTAVFTNLTRDHLDYHKTMEAYAEAKARLFVWPGLRAAVINLDDAFGLKLARECAASLPLTIGYTLEARFENPPAGMRVLAAADIRAASAGMSFDVLWAGRRHTLSLPLVGRFNVANLLAVLGSLLAGGIAFEQASEAVKGLTPPPGRMQIVSSEMEPLVVIDYAHTPDALEQALLALRPSAKERGGKLICVFGCGGDRDAGKRPLMGALAARLADVVVVTSDNPRTEDPAAIVDQVARTTGGLALRIVDRAEAIAETLKQAASGDVVLIAGKGAEPYQEIAGVKFPFSDAEHARAALHQRGKGGQS
jgi:UDP-N-acetylmuramoyl-L-alanyl-D-glutamate--2,6-diaminopimelate ligase